MVARSATEVQVYPVVETTQKDNICHTVVAPAQVPSSAIALARDMAERAITSFDGFGIFGIEMFLLKVTESFLFIIYLYAAWYIESLYSFIV
jgi:phosphoribosylaminoimidazole carboxylase (NCAIR synthetase)